MDLLAGVAGDDDLEIPESLFKKGWILGEIWIKETELLAIELLRDLFRASKIQDAEHSIGNKEVAGVRVRMEEIQVMDLMAVKIPKGLPDQVPLFLRGFSIGKSVKWYAIDPSHA